MRILLLANNVAGLISFRFEVVKAIIEQGHFITISAPFDKRMNELEAIGAKCVTTEIDRRSTNPVKDFMLICHYVNLIRKENQMWFVLYNQAQCLWRDGLQIIWYTSNCEYYWTWNCC